MEKESEVSVHEGFAHALCPMTAILSRSGLVLEHTSFLVIKIPAGTLLLFTCQNIQKLLVLHYLFPEASIPSRLLILSGKLPAIRQTTLSTA